MVLEALIFCIDNSDWTRNGDYQPTRWDSQIEAANIISESKSDKNPENSLGVVSMAGRRVETPVTLTQDLAKILKSFREIKISGESDFITSINISMLLLKHRQNKNQKQRILLFVASPVKNTVDEMVLLGKKLKKNNVAIDIISFGNVDQNRESLNQLYSNTNNSNNSSYLEVGLEQYVVDCLFTSPILNDNMYEEPQVISNNNDTNQNNQAQPSASQPTGGLSQFERDINLAIQQSIEEEERRQKLTDEKKANPNEKKEEKEKEIKEEDEEDIDAELEKARLLSIQEHENLLKKEKEEEKKIKDELISNEEFLKDVLDEIGIKEDEENASLLNGKNKNEKENKENTKK